MSSLSSIISVLNSDEKRLFINRLQQKNKRHDTKNIELFKLLEAGTTSSAIKERLYTNQPDGAYHALNKRLSDSLIDFLAARSFDSETAEEMNILKLLLAARILFERKQVKAGFKTINKAEKLALKYEFYNILNEIYHTLIQYAHLNPNVNLDNLVKKLNNNGKRYISQQRLNIVYAKIKHQLDKTKINDNTGTSIHAIIDQYTSANEEILDVKSVYRLMEICNTAAKVEFNYYQILPTMRFLFQHIEDKQEQIDKHLFYYIKILFIKANTLFRNKLFDESMLILNLLHTQLEKKRAVYKSVFKGQLQLLLALNQNYTGNALKAIDILEETIKIASKQLRLQYDARLALVMCYFNREQYKTSFGQLNQLKHSNTYYEKKMGREWVIKKDIIEILLLIELDYIDLTESRLASFRKTHRNYLKQTNEERTLQFISLIQLYYNNQKEVNTATFKEKVESSFEWIGVEQEDLFVMSFYAWLKSKMENAALYITTLNLIKKATAS